MAALITSQPILVATAAMDRSSQNTNLVGSFDGPQLTIGTNRYAALADNAAPGFKVYKSTDSGAIWTLMDAANSPGLASFPLYKIVHDATSFSFVWEGDGGDVPLAQLGLAKFDTVTDLWGTVFPSGVVNMTSNTPFNVIAERSDGSIVCVFRSENPTPNNLQWGAFDAAGAFTGPFDFNITSTQLKALAAATGPDDTIHVLIQDGLGPFDIFHQTISPLNVVSAPSAVATLGAGTPDSFLSGLPRVDSDLDQIIFPFSDDAGAPSHTAMFVGAPVAAPIWTQETLETGLPAADFAYPVIHNPISGDLEIYQTVGQTGLLQLWRTSWDGTTLGAPELVYDGIANPPAAGAVQEILKASVSQFSPIEILVAMQLTAGSPPENTYFLAASVPLSIICDSPPAGKLRLPYSHAFPAFDGQPPYTFSISAGALPPGLSLDPTTGIVSGTPTISGFYEFAVTVTDELDSTASVGCSITIKTCLLVEVGS